MIYAVLESPHSQLSFDVLIFEIGAEKEELHGVTGVLKLHVKRQKIYMYISINKCAHFYFYL